MIDIFVVEGRMDSKIRTKSKLIDNNRELILSGRAADWCKQGREPRLALGFDDMSTRVGRFVSSPREREKRDRIVMEMKERDRKKYEQEWKWRNRRNKNIPPLTLPDTRIVCIAQI